MFIKCKTVFDQALLELVTNILLNHVLEIGACNGWQLASTKLEPVIELLASAYELVEVQPGGDTQLLNRMRGQESI